ncbi:MAG: hypothetical protein GWM98_06505, partial [Nitrospinaceae bacterium]|nr:hypothetical protein [Nitrospinaceae bacterium]NIR54207.1 hypothetical protein [Nitrospinaceae bacterium]NIS84622.1 hypothetical protein [Nitrospinaceae bacterium]NIT81417.1 hypothetical protein [Nitrospinaceae bacterium]NIU43701.1 hypothetical protein [Nitrospinaceae bacterium]
ELTYSLVVPIPHPWFPSNLRDSFRIVSQALLAGLSCLGVPDARMALGPPVGAARRTRSPSCFASMNHFEIHVRGRKLIGSAQRRKKSAFLQHGSVGITCNRELENSLFRFESPALRQENLEELKNHTLSLQELFGVELSRGTVLRAFKEGFMNSFPARWVPGTLTPEEREKVDSSSIQNSSNERGMILTF